MMKSKGGGIMLGERICLLRRRLGWSQAELARQLRVSSSTVGMYEQGRREPSLNAAVELSRAFGVSVDYLLTGKPLTQDDCAVLQQTLQQSLSGFRQNPRGLSKEELAVLVTAVMREA